MIINLIHSPNTISFSFSFLVETAKLAEAAKQAEEVEVKRKILEAKGFVNDEAIDSLDTKIVLAQEVALVSTRNAEEVARLGRGQ